jgi:DNA-binding response OmpR family regulator/HPt (histidine-containing phosphotransfer) domain-containing protein
MKILILEDNEWIAKKLDRILSSQNYAVEIFNNGQMAKDAIEIFPYDLIIVDATLSHLDGIAWCREIRANGQKNPILLLIEADDNQNGVAGLDAGADDYLPKPLDSQELLARVRALLRRGNSTSLPILEWGELRLNPSTYEVTYQEKPLSLTPKEYAILELFLRNPRRVFSCGAILDHLWEFQKIPGENAVRTHIKELRHKFKAVGANSDIIETVYGIGYRLKEAKLVATQESSLPKQQTVAAINEVWQRFQPRIYEQLTIIERASHDLLAQTPDGDVQAALAEAHTLAGALGTFGLSKGSQIARKIETLLGSDALRQGSRQRVWESEETSRLQKLVRVLRQEIDRAAERTPSEPSKSDERSFLLVIDSDLILSESIAHQAHNWGFKVDMVSDLTQAQDAISLQLPDVVLLDPSVSETLEESYQLIAQLAGQTPPIPVLIFSDRDSLKERLEFVKSGGGAFLQKPMPSARVLEAIAQVLHRGKPPDAKILVVDDDPKILAILRAMLEPWGLTIATLDEPLHFWEILEAVSPDLLILDIKMPHVNGIELCQVIRNDARWGGLPIIVLTANNSPKIVDRVFAVGADDFVSKPVVGPELIARIINRLERLKLLQRLARSEAFESITF